MDLVFNYDIDLPKPTPMKQKFLCDKVEYLKTLPQHEQKSSGWYEMRMSLLSASDWGTILGVNHYSKPESVLLKKCGVDNFVTNDAMKWGNKYEDVAIAIYEYRNSTKVYEFGCIRHPAIEHLGASPDGITSEGVMLEIKCPVTRQITGIPPEYYWCQVQGQLEVCELDRCDFLECKLREYDNEDEYLNDNFNGDYSKNKIGFEKGIVVEFYKIDSQSFYYDYSPVCLIGNEMNKWKSYIVDKHTLNNPNVILSTFDYWTLDEVSCVPIFRNQEWFQRSEKELTKFWNKVHSYRILAIDNLRNDEIFDKNEWSKYKDDLLINFWNRALNYRDYSKLRDDLIFTDNILISNVYYNIQDFWERIKIYREDAIIKLKEDLQCEKNEKKRIKQLERDEKNKIKEDTKKQKKIKEYIILDDNVDNNTNDVKTNESLKKCDDIDVIKSNDINKMEIDNDDCLLSSGLSFFSNSEFVTNNEIVDKKPIIRKDYSDDDESNNLLLNSTMSLFS